MRGKNSVGEECPVCGQALQGTRFTGFTCTKCKSHFSGKFIMHLKRREFSNRINEHFSPLPSTVPVVTKQEFVVEDDGRIEAAIERTHASVQEAAATVISGINEANAALEDIVGVSEEARTAQAQDDVVQQPDAPMQAAVVPLKIMKPAMRSTPQRSHAKTPGSTARKTPGPSRTAARRTKHVLRPTPKRAQKRTASRALKHTAQPTKKSRQKTRPGRPNVKKSGARKASRRR